MPNATNLRAALAVPAIALGVLAMAGDSARPAFAAPPACEVTAPDTVAVGQRMAALSLKYNQDIGDSITATFPAESKVTVSKVVRGGEPMSADLTLNTEYAIAGKWKVSLTGQGGECTGDVTVAKK